MNAVAATPVPPMLKQCPAYRTMDQRVEASCYHLSGADNWYPPVMLNADTVKRMLFNGSYIEETVRLYERLTADAYIEYLLAYYRTGLQRYGAHWHYADIVTVLLALCDFLKPTAYLEVGVRRGRSVCAVATRAPRCSLHMFDMWSNKNYAGMENPGPELVERELDRLGHSGRRQYVIGNSHQTLPQFFAANPDFTADLATVDGDHSFDGAVADLCDVLPRLKVGGAIVFDDICHPQKLHLRNVWKLLVEDDARFSSASIDDIGYGVGFGIRLW